VIKTIMSIINQFKNNRNENTYIDGRIKEHRTEKEPNK
jgi:hypothetical protein